MKAVNGIIILEGGDATGKTTLAHELVSRYDAFYVHNGLWPNMWQRHLAAVDLAIKKSQTGLVVIDRLWISEQIYGQVFRAGPAYDLGARCLDQVLQRHGALTVICIRDLEKHVQHFEKLKTVRPEKFKSVREVAVRYYDLAVGNLARGGREYVNQLTRWQDYAARTDVTLYDMDHCPIVSTAKRLVKLVELCRDQALPGQFDAGRPNLAGHPATAQYLFVGEALSPRACQRAAPFLWNDEPSAASWLNERLRAINFDETAALWTNAKSADDWLPTILDNRSPYLKVIALGRVAAARLNELGLQSRIELPHPQWARRFNAGDPKSYERLLREAMR